MPSSPQYAPDGMTSAAGDPDRSAGTSQGYAPPDSVLAQDRQDDGLVHNHGWAVSGRFDRVTKGISGGAKFATSAIVRSPKMESFHAHDEVWADDGLVHNHAWAVSGK